MVARIFPVELPARSILIAVAFSTLATLVNGCGGTSDRSGTIAGTITVFAAASLVNSFRDLADAFQDQHPQVQVEYHFAGSQTLSTQLTHGAAADVFAAADARQMAVASNAGLLNGKPVYFAANRMVVVAPIDSQAVVSLTDLAKRDVTVAMGTEQLPAGVYARQSLALMAGDADFPSGFADSVLANVVTNETSVRAVAQKVALGEVDAGFVYQTDASAGQFSTMFRVIDIPGHLNVAVQYPIATVAAGAQRRIVADYVEFVLGAEGRAILLQHGFGAPSTAECPCTDSVPGVMGSWVSVNR